MSSEWQEITLGEFVRLQRGHDLTASEQRQGAIPVMGSAGQNGTHNEAKAFGPGVVIGRSGASMGRVHRSKVDFWPHNTCLYVTDFLGNCPRFVYYVLKTLDLAAYNSGSAQPSLNRNYIYSVRLRVPSRSEQDSIGEFLETLDDRIALLRETNSTLEGIAEALFQSWFVDFDPVRAKQDGRVPDGMDEATAALFPDSFEESALGLVPAGWRVGPILEIACLLSGGTPKTTRPELWGGSVPWASAKDVSQSANSMLIATERTITQRGLEESSTRLVPALSTVVVARGATTGRMVILGVTMAMNQTCYALESRAGTPLALYCQLRREIDALVGAAHGSVFDTITTSTFAQSKVVQPAQPLLKKFEAAVDPIFQKILVGTSALQTLATLRDTLLPRLISGQLRLPDTAEMAIPPKTGK